MAENTTIISCCYHFNLLISVKRLRIFSLALGKCDTWLGKNLLFAKRNGKLYWYSFWPFCVKLQRRIAKQNAQIA